MIMRSIAWRIVSFIAYIVSYQLAVDSSCGAAGIVENLRLDYAVRARRRTDMTLPF